MLGITYIGILGMCSWVLVKKIRHFRLDPVLTKKLNFIKSVIDRINFKDANAQLDEILPKIEMLNTSNLNLE
ncbi:MAG: hypothetical protein JW776_11750 [Candidatus Lokiarchaeota archaeon]|nr:hypothetical protein [Candidatus Lokiarchaeota archaeon]